MRKLLSTLLALCMLLALLPGTVLAADGLPEDHNVPGTVEWSFPKITGAGPDETVTRDTYSGKIRILIIFRANGICGLSNDTMSSLAKAEWLEAENVKVIAVGMGENEDDRTSVRNNVIAYREEFAPNCENIDFCYATSRQSWDAIHSLQSLIGEDSNSITYAVNYIFDSEGNLRFAWQGGYEADYYTNAIALLGDGSESGWDAGRIRLDGVNDYSAAYALFDSMNALRRENGLSPLVMDAELLPAAMKRAAELAVNYSYTRPDGSKYDTIFPAKFHYASKIEDIAIWNVSAGEVLTEWKDSFGHMLDEKYKSAGVGVFIDSNGCYYWAQLLASEEGTYEIPRSGGTRAVTASVKASPDVLKLSVSPASASLEPGGSAVLTGLTANRRFDLSAPCVHLTYAASESPEIAAVSVEKDGRAVVTAVSAGKTTLKLGVNVFGAAAPLTVDVPVTVRVPAAVSVPAAFSDVPAGEYYAGPVAWAVENKITTGTSDTAFSPDETCTTAQILTFLWRSQGEPEPTIGNPFTDVPSGEYYYKAALWANEKGLVSGTEFGGATPCTRAETMNYLWKLAGSPPAPAAPFTDVPYDSIYVRPVAYALSEGITTGTSDTEFSPWDTCTRGQIVTFLYRAYAEDVYVNDGPGEPEDSVPPAPDIPPEDTRPVITPEAVYESMIALKGEYPEGMRWTNDNYYAWNGGIYSGGFGCAGFAFMLSDAAFGTLPARMETPSFDAIRVGDILRINNDTHSVIVLEVRANGVVIAEGNYNSSIHWGRILTADQVNRADYAMTRYPE